MHKSFKPVPWFYGANIYEVNLRQYTVEGTFGAFAQHLPRLKEMGIKILWFMPVTQISREKRQGILGSYYACSSYTEVNPEYGTKEEFKALIHYAHELGFKVIMDWVANHTGYDHQWAKEHPEWYMKDVNGNFTEQYGWVDVIDLDYREAAMRVAMIEAMKFWINEFDIDGFRCDMAHLVPLDFWKEARPACDGIKPLFWLAECDESDYLEVFDINYAWNWMHAIEKVVKNQAPLQLMRNVLNDYNKSGAFGRKLFFTSNHDENSWNGTEYEKYGAAAKTLAVFTCTWPGLPLIYSGQELPNLKRLKFFEKDVIEWNKPEKLYDFYTCLLKCRQTNAAFHKDAVFIELETNEPDKVFAYMLKKDQSKVLVLLNLSGYGKVQFTLNNDNLPGNYHSVFSGVSHALNENERFELQAWEYIVYATAE